MPFKSTRKLLSLQGMSQKRRKVLQVDDCPELLTRDLQKKTLEQKPKRKSAPARRQPGMQLCNLA